MNSKASVFSIITITYNSANTIAKTIESVISQRYPHVEYIIVDGGSTDATLDILNKYNSKIARWISEKDEGISDAMNKGIGMATGEIIGIIHADDWYEDSAFKAVADCFNETGAEIVCGRVKYWKAGTPDYVYDSDPSKLHLEMTVNHPSVFIKKETYERLGTFDKRYKFAMDYDLMLRMKSSGAKIESLKKIIANMSLDGASDKNWAAALRECRDIKVRNGTNFIKADIYYLRQYFRASISRFFKLLGFEFILKFYRKYFSILKKEKYDGK